MSSGVLLEVPRSFEALVAEAAFVGTFAGVDAEVRDEAATFRERLLALLVWTHVGPFARLRSYINPGYMRPLVNAQSGQSRVALPADEACLAFLGRPRRVGHGYTVAQRLSLLGLRCRRLAGLIMPRKSYLGRNESFEVQRSSKLALKVGAGTSLRSLLRLFHTHVNILGGSNCLFCHALTIVFIFYCRHYIELSSSYRLKELLNYAIGLITHKYYYSNVLQC